MNAEIGLQQRRLLWRAWPPLLVIFALYAGSAQLPPSWIGGAAWLVAVTVAILSYRGLSSAASREHRATSRRAVIRWSIVAIAILVVGYIVAGVVFGRAENSDVVRNTVLYGHDRTYFATVYVVAIPVIEEAAFRGIIYNIAIDQRARPPIAIMFTSVAFAMAHALAHWSFAVVPSALVLGLVLGVTRWASGGVTAPAALHALNNAAGLLVQ